MPRPFKCRRVFFSPDVTYFKPAGIPMRNLDEVNMTLDELEAIRLADLEGLYQENAAQKMGISRQTFGNIIASAHLKVADCLINGKTLKINGGTITMLQERKFTCSDCRHEWSVPFGTGRPEQCPSCKSVNIHRSESDRGPSGGRGRKGKCGMGRYGRQNSKENLKKKGDF